MWTTACHGPRRQVARIAKETCTAMILCHGHRQHNVRAECAHEGPRSDQVAESDQARKHQQGVRVLHSPDAGPWGNRRGVHLLRQWRLHLRLQILVSTVQRVCRDDWHHFMPLRPEQHEAHGRHGALFANHAGRRARLHRCLSATSLLFGYIADLRLRRGQHIVNRAALTGRREAPAEGWGLVVPVAEHHGPRDERLRLKVVSWNLTWR
jgi:hypothetical protein